MQTRYFDKIYAGHNKKYNEVTWFYVSEDNVVEDNPEPDSYVTFNYADGAWTIGTLDRNVWHDAQGFRQVPFAFDKDGNPASEKEIKTAGKPHQIVLDPDVKTIKANGEDLCYVTVFVVDKKGIPCPTATNQLTFKVKGEGTFRAACNGDATSLELFHLPTMKLFSGKLVVLIQSTENAGNIILSVSGKGLKKENISLKSFK